MAADDTAVTTLDGNIRDIYCLYCEDAFQFHEQQN